ncbi:DUF29 domain-containing protein [Zavarzinia aquatilis]|uniref:DUF29 domain-containing protein n=1 Tax=Zavarzinia aquatilis TaxID=2211142 RepID=A0A317E5C6_9PROT|nr:DUF29 domain-containing protein [Zavarzinia aquatilis]PWR21376.1 DUF29 domain-containing protein [Zavarzinia aquatilis]
MAVTNRSLYHRDFYAWANEQAALLRAGKLDKADIANIAEEIESVGRGEKREPVNRLAHLLKWRQQRIHRSPSWQATIRLQRRALADHLADNPSLKTLLDEAVTRAYGTAVIEAGAETGLPEANFREACP